jgi:hypothetical protein
MLPIAIIGKKFIAEVLVGAEWEDPQAYDSASLRYDSPQCKQPKKKNKV